MSRARLVDLLRNEILNLDLAELDFGVYRILNYRRAEVEEFFDHTLPDLIKSALAESPGITEDQICNALYTFFRRHCTATVTLIPQSRRSQHAKYSIPYNGEDTLLYWRGRGTHYVKTTEELSRYRFTHAGWTVTCQLVDAEADELPGKTRYFVPIAVDALPTTRDLVISFVFLRHSRPKRPSLTRALTPRTELHGPSKRLCFNSSERCYRCPHNCQSAIYRRTCCATRGRTVRTISSTLSSVDFLATSLTIMCETKSSTLRPTINRSQPLFSSLDGRSLRFWRISKTFKLASSRSPSSYWVRATGCRFVWCRRTFGRGSSSPKPRWLIGRTCCVRFQTKSMPNISRTIRHS